MEGHDLKELRKSLGLSLSEASLQVHVTARAWCRWEAGERRIPEGAIELFCNKNGIEYPPKVKKKK